MLVNVKNVIKFITDYSSFYFNILLLHISANQKSQTDIEKQVKKY